MAKEQCEGREMLLETTKRLLEGVGMGLVILGRPDSLEFCLC